MENKKISNNKYEKMFEKVFRNGIKGEKDNNIRMILEKISSDDNLSQKDKENIYDNIFEYVIKINESFESKIEEIHKRGIKEGSLMSFTLNNESKEDEVDRELYLELEEFILERINDNSKLSTNTDYIKNTNEIEQIKNNITDNELSSIEELYNLYDFRTDIKTIEEYKIGFKDSMDFFLETFENKLNN